MDEDEDVTSSLTFVKYQKVCFSSSQLVSDPSLCSGEVRLKFVFWVEAPVSVTTQ